MKKINIFLMTIFSLSLMMTSCEEQLEERVYSELLASNAYETVADADALLTAVYSGMRGAGWGTYYTYDYIYISEAPTDTYGVDLWAPEDLMEAGLWDNNYAFIVNLWDGAYKIIGSANFAIEVFEGMDIPQEDKNRLLGEAKFLRALAYYDLAFNFGDVILNLGGDSADKPLSPQSEVIAQVLKDLTDAASLLENTNTPGRASKGAALALRAKTHLNAKNWAEAATDAKDVMELGEFALMPSVEDLFDSNNNGAEEWIFVYMSTQDGSGPGMIIGWFALGQGFQNGGWGRLSIAGDFYKTYDLEDERRGLIGNGYQKGDMGENGEGKPRWYALPGTPEFDDLTANPEVGLTTINSLTSTKYLGGHDRFTYRDLSQAGNNYPILRYADIILTRAEAMNETGDSGGALEFLNQIRSRSNAAPLAGLDQSSLRDAIFDERAKEFVMEGQRRLDLIRSGKYIEQWRANLERKYPTSNFGYLNEDRIFFPIPQKELDANKELGQ